MKKKNRAEAENAKTEKEKDELQNKEHNIKKEALGRNTKR